MGVIIRFFVRHYYLMLFVVLQIVSIYLIYKKSHFHQVIGNSFVLETVARYESFQQYTRHFANLPSINDSLSEVIARLQEERMQAKWIDTSTTYQFNDSITKQQYTYTAAKVLKASTQFRKNYLIINKGSKQGVTLLAAVMGERGVIGIVKEVSENYAIIMPILHSALEIPARLKNEPYSGTITWNGKNYQKVQLSDIPKHAPIKLGDTIVTSTFSNIYPENIPIGIVVKISPPNANSIYDIEVKLIEDLKKTAYVWLIQNLRKAEREQLENKATP